MTLPVNLPKAVKWYCDLWWHATNHTHYVSPLLCLMTTSARTVRTLCFAVQSLGSLDLPEVLSSSRASTSRATGQNRAPLEFRGLPLLIASVFFTVLFEPKTTFSVGQLSLSRPLFSKPWVEGCTDMGSPHTDCCRSAYSSVCTHVIQLF